MEKTTLKEWQKFVEDYKKIRNSFPENALQERILSLILSHGRLPNTNNFPPLHEFGITFPNGAIIKIPFTHYGLGRKFTIINEVDYAELAST